MYCPSKWSADPATIVNLRQVKLTADGARAFVLRGSRPDVAVRIDRGEAITVAQEILRSTMMVQTRGGA